MATVDLKPQTFGENAVTQLPALDFFQYVKSQLPQVYQNAPNLMALLQVIATQKQYLYDVIRSLINSFNLNDTGKGSDSATPSGIYAQMIASVFNAPYAQGSTDSEIIIAAQNAITFVNSRGTFSDFYRYFYINGLADSFTNANIQEDGNATIFFNVPVFNTPDNPPNPFEIFLTSMQKLKGAGIEIIANPANTTYFQYGSLPTDDPPYQVAPGNAGFGILQADGTTVINGGFFMSL